MKKSDYISRNECAELLGVHPQSVSNYLEHKLLAGKKISDKVYILRQSALEFAKKHISYIKAEESAVEQYVKSLRDGIEELEEKLSRLEKEAWLYGRVVNVKSLFLSLCCHFQDILSQREMEMVRRYVSGHDLEYISDEFGVSPERCRQIIYKTLNKISKAGAEIVLRDGRISELERRCANQHIHIKKLEEAIGEHNKENKRICSVKHKSNPWVNVPVSSLNLSMRIMNIIKHGLQVETVGELCEVTKIEFLKCRNAGKKSLTELIEELDRHGLKLAGSV